MSNNYGCCFGFNKFYMLQPWPWARNQSQGLQRCMPRVNPKSHISCSWKCRGVWGNEPPHSQVSSHFGSWSANGLLNLQRVIVGARTHCMEYFLIPLESSWNLDVWNELSWPIWVLKTWFMAKRKVGSQIANLSPEH
jgi:hypothetical protein